MHESVAIVLAAGHSTRMGHPKALTDVAGEPALARIVTSCKAAGVSTILVVVGAHADRIRESLPALDPLVTWVVNPDPDAGRTGSLQRALAHDAALAAQTLLVWPVDHPLATASTAHRILSTHGLLVVPEHAGRGGHPVVMRGAAIAEARALAADAPLRDVFHRDPQRVVRLAVNDAGILANLDTPQDTAAHVGPGPNGFARD